MLPVEATISQIRKETEMKLEKAIERAFDRCNLIGDECDIYSVIYSYKAIRELSDEEVDKIYDYIAKGLGFSRW